MEFDLWTFGLQTINFIALVWLLKVFLYSPVMAAIARRQAENALAMENAQQVEKLAQSKNEKLNAIYEKIDEERKQILADARIAESRAYDKLIQQGREEVDKLRDLAQQDIEREYHKAEVEMRRGATDLAITLARHILMESQSGDLNAMFLEKIIAHFKSITPAEFSNIEDHLTDGDLNIITAEKLNAATQKRWSKAIDSVFNSKASFTFSVNQSLIAGANIQFPNGLIRFNWQDSLDEIKATLYERADHP